MNYNESNDILVSHGVCDEDLAKAEAELDELERQEKLQKQSEREE